MNLSQYVRKRNGVPLGAKGSIINMLSRSLGAGRFSVFWNYWNPVWGYYLGKYIFRPLKTFLPGSISVLITFIVSGLLHDVFVILIKKNFEFLIAPWFFLIGLCVILTDIVKIDYSKFPWIVRASINSSIIISTLLIAFKIRIVF